MLFVRQIGRNIIFVGPPEIGRSSTNKYTVFHNARPNNGIFKAKLKLLCYIANKNQLPNQKDDDTENILS